MQAHLLQSMEVDIMFSTSTVSNSDVLKNKALQVRLNRKKINRNKMDKELGMEFREQKGVLDASAMRVNKSIFTKAATEKYMDIYAQASKYFYNVTLPWDDKGWRLLSIDIYKDFTKKMKQFTTDYRSAVLDFIDHIAEHVEEARGVLGEAFNPKDYKFLADNGGINNELLLEQFTLDVEFDVISTGDDLRAVLTEKDREVVAELIDKQVKRKFTLANEHIIMSLRDCVFAIHERLCKDTNVFRDTLISNLEDLCDLIPRMNIADDPAINKIAADAKAKLTKWDPQVQRDESKPRKEVAKSAKAILDNMEGII